MSLQGTNDVDGRFLTSGDESGTAPDDRRFRPDVEGLRAVAVLLVVLYHTGVPLLTGGFVGVDVFFVISGFVITGLLLRERAGTGHTSILAFYARRCRRILPAATLVIVVTIFFSYVLLGLVTGNNTADDGRWAAAFLANFHFEEIGTNYLSALRPPSPLQNYWSLSVEEQFYVVYPTLFLVVARARGGLTMRVRMAIALGLVIVASYSLSIFQTASHPAAAYFSPFTRAWELAIGALVAVATSWLKHIPAQVAAVLTWAGLAAIAYSAFAFNTQTAYPGSLVAVPVVGAALIIAGGVATPRAGVESLLGLQPFQWFGKLSYSLYLWHWPILIIAAAYAGKTSLSLHWNLLLVIASLAISLATYRLVENPVRHSSLRPRQSVLLGAGLVVITVVAISLVIAAESVSTTGYRVIPASNTEAVLHQVAAAPKISTVPNPIEPSLTQAGSDWAGFLGDLHYGCASAAAETTVRVRICTIGDTKGKHLMVVYGDSHTLMWLPAFNYIAATAHWRLVLLARPFCPAETVPVENPPGLGRAGGPYAVCADWHKWAVHAINEMHPDLVVVSQESLYKSPSSITMGPTAFNSATWKSGLVALLGSLSLPHAQEVVLGNIPLLPYSGPACLAAHMHDVQACSASTQSSALPLNLAEQAAASEVGARYVDPTPWFCSTTCTAIVGHYVVYLDQYHVTGTYAQYLEVVLGRALGVPAYP